MVLPCSSQYISDTGHLINKLWSDKGNLPRKGSETKRNYVHRIRVKDYLAYELSKSNHIGVSKYRLFETYSTSDSYLPTNPDYTVRTPDKLVIEKHMIVNDCHMIERGGFFIRRKILVATPNIISSWSI